MSQGLQRNKEKYQEKKPPKDTYTCPGGTKDKRKYIKEERNPRNTHMHVPGVQRTRKSLETRARVSPGAQRMKEN